MPNPAIARAKEALAYVENSKPSKNLWMVGLHKDDMRVLIELAEAGLLTHQQDGA